MPAGSEPVEGAEPFLPFTRPTIDEETIAGVAEVLRSGWITSGPQVKAFEARLTEFFGGRPVRAFNSGTGTMEIALRLAGVGPGHEVITTPLSWVATSNVILTVGARPVFVDIDPVTRNLDLDRVAAAITPATRALLPVDLAGLPVDRDRLYALARTHGLRVIEDAAQSFGSTLAGPPHRVLGRFRVVQLPPQQEHHEHRGRLPGPQRRARRQTRRAIPPAGRRPRRAGRHGGRGAGRQI